MNRGALALGLGATVLVATGAFVAFRSGQPAGERASATSSPRDPGDQLIPQRSNGSPAAPVVVYELSDFQCPYCRLFWEETMPVLEKEYVATGKIRIVFLNYPIAQLHPNAPAAHTFAMCAAAQDRFWPVHDLLFRYQARWEHEVDPSGTFRALADSARLDRQKLAACLASRPHQPVIEAETRDAMRAGIGGTPAFVINGGIMTGAQPIDIWRPILDSILRGRREDQPED